MSEIGEMWSDHKAERSAKKKSNLEYSTVLLENEGIQFTSHNNGIHLVVENPIDFWLSTGKYIIRSTGKHGRGVRNLLKEIKRG